MESRANVTALFKGKFKNPKTLYVSETPGGEISAMPTDVFAKKIGVTWSEANVVETEHALEMHTSDTSLEISEWFVDMIVDQLKEQQDKIVISYMNDTVGYGVFARRNIPQGVYVMSYMGLLQAVSERVPVNNHSNPYAVGIARDSEMCGSVNSETYRNMGAMAQHVPESASQYLFNDGKEKVVATQNIYPMEFTYQGYPLIAFKTARQIHQGEMLGWNYGNKYWMALDKVPCLFTRQGEILDPMFYQAEKITLHLPKREGSSSHVDFELSFTNRHDFFMDGTFKMQAEPHEILGVTFEDFMNLYQQHPQSPYVRLSCPSFIIPLDVSPQEDESLAAEAPAKTPTKSVASKGSSFSFHGQTKSTAVCEALNGISASFDITAKWTYSAKNDTAYLSASDSDAMQNLNAYLKSNQVETRFGRHQTTKEPLIYVVKPTSEQLRKIAEGMMPQPRVALSAGK